MSKLFYDHLIVLNEIHIEVKDLGLEHEEKEELHSLVEEMIHHRVVGRILNHLPREHHEDFLTKFHERPYDQNLIHYIDDKIEESIEEHITDEMNKLKEELMEDIRLGKLSGPASNQE